MPLEKKRPLPRLERLLATIPLCGVALLLALVGWPHDPATLHVMQWISRALAGVYGVLFIAAWVLRPQHWNHLRQDLPALMTAALILATAIFERPLENWLFHHIPGFGLHGWFVIIVAGQQLLALGVHIRDLLPWFERHFVSRFSPAVLLVGTFFLLVLGGTLLLKMPNCTVGSLSWLDTLFTSTSAVCVTGLIVTDTGSSFTLLGQGILLGLIQLGGFGIVSLTYFLALLAGQGLSISSRVLLRDLLSEDNLRSLGTNLGTFIGLTLLIELVGAIVLYGFWKDALPAGHSPLWFSVFHSVSAFCNAGFSLFPQSLAAPAADSRALQGTIMALIVVGGIGFPVILELMRRIGPRLRFRSSRTKRLSLHARLALSTTACLLLGGTLLLWLAGHGSAHDGGLWSALFNAITARTAGFNLDRMSDLTPAAVAVMIFLMFIGGSPGGIAGGIKTTTFAVAMLNLRRILLGQREVNLGGRRLDEAILLRAFAIVLLSQIWIIVAAGILLFLQPEGSLIDALFETVSAFATVGLSRGLTETLHPISKIVIVLTMFVGRVGILNFFFTFLTQMGRDQRLRYPSERVIID